MLTHGSLAWQKVIKDQMGVPITRRGTRLKLNWRDADTFISAVHSQERVSGLTHDFYKYPARFSPQFCRAAIDVFSAPGDLIVDPFVGGGTTLVESRVNGRLSIGTDISSLASFVSRVKTRVYSVAELAYVEEWFEDLVNWLTVRNKSPQAYGWKEAGYLRNLDTPQTWPIRKLLEIALANAGSISTPKLQEFVRCVLLRTAQWALDGRRKIPSAKQFRTRMRANATTMAAGAREFSSRTRVADRAVSVGRVRRTICLNLRAENLAGYIEARGRPLPRLIITSPPYPGVHVLYHRWQVHGGRETPAPFWVADQLDGSGESFYLMNARSRDPSRYLSGIEAAFTAARQVAADDTILVQVVAFSQPEEQLPQYLAVMDKCGFHERFLSEHLDSSDGRLWRDVPGRRWHANKKGSLGSSQEVVLLHTPSQDR